MLTLEMTTPSRVLELTETALNMGFNDDYLRANLLLDRAKALIQIAQNSDADYQAAIEAIEEAVAREIEDPLLLAKLLDLQSEALFLSHNDVASNGVIQQAIDLPFNDDQFRAQLYFNQCSRLRTTNRRGLNQKLEICERALNLQIDDASIMANLLREKSILLYTRNEGEDLSAAIAVCERAETLESIPLHLKTELVCLRGLYLLKRNDEGDHRQVLRITANLPYDTSTLSLLAFFSRFFIAEYDRNLFG